MSETPATDPSAASPEVAPDVAPDARPSGPDWVAAFAAALGTTPPTSEEIEELLSLAGTAAHASERLAAPLACWLVGRAGTSPAEAHAVARGIDAR